MQMVMRGSSRLARRITNGAATTIARPCTIITAPICCGL